MWSLAWPWALLALPLPLLLRRLLPEARGLSEAGLRVPSLTGFETLGDFAASALDPAEVLRLITPVLQALTAAHAQGLAGHVGGVVGGQEGDRGGEPGTLLEEGTAVDAAHGDGPNRGWGRECSRRGTPDPNDPRGGLSNHEPARITKESARGPATRQAISEGSSVPRTMRTVSPGSEAALSISRKAISRALRSSFS